MGMRKSNRPLSSAQLKILAHSVESEWSTLFPGRAQKFLREQKRAWLAANPIDVRASTEQTLQKEKASKRELESKYRLALSDIEDLRQQLEVFQQLSASPIEVSEIHVDSKTKKHSAAAVILASDWHFEERVDSDKVNGLNEFNLEIAHARAEKFFKNSAKLIQSQTTVDVPEVVLWLGGDFISGNIHEDIAQNCLLGPMEAIMTVQNVLASGIEYLLKELPGVRFHLPTSYGNHGRITKDRRSATAATNNLEWFMYNNLAWYFADHAERSRLSFQVSRGKFTYCNVNGVELCFHHGDTINYRDGVGGIAIPVNKAIDKRNRGRRADLHCFGHFHTSNYTPTFVSNGSLIGYGSYALDFACTPEPAQQQFFLIDAKRRRPTGNFHIHLD